MEVNQLEMHGVSWAWDMPRAEWRKEIMEYFTVDEIAKRLKVTPLTIRRWLNNGELDGTRLSAGVARAGDQ